MNILTQIKNEIVSKGMDPSSRSAINWFVSKITSLGKNEIRADIVRNTDNYSSGMVIGKMFFFYYDPKHKDKLPYYDRFPLVFPIERYSDGFLGLNLHYLSPGRRLQLLQNLKKTANNTKLNASTRLKISYDIIAQTSSLDDAKPCIKRYLYSQVRSRFVMVPADEWYLSIYLPVESFVNGQTKKAIKGPGRTR